MEPPRIRKRKRTGVSRWSVFRQKRDRVSKYVRDTCSQLQEYESFAAARDSDDEICDNPPVLSPDAVMQDVETKGYTGSVSVENVGPALGDYSSTGLFQAHGHVSCEDASYSVLDVDDEYDCNDSVSKSFSIADNLSLRDQLARWAVFFSIPAVAVSALLKILLFYDVAVGLPKDSRTLLKTARCVVTKKVSGGEYFHFGISESLCLLFEGLRTSVFEKLDSCLSVIFSTDGLPCFKSVNTHVWPITGSLLVGGRCTTPFTIGLFYGVDKEMEVNEFLADFVQDLKHCQTNGFMCRNRLFKVKVHCFVCDAPARSFVKNVLGHGGKHGCERCKVKGKKLRGMTFNDENAERRTNASLLDSTEIKHRRGASPLAEAGVKLVTHFVLDYMHLVLLGVTRKLMYLWLEGEKKVEKKTYRIKPSSAKQISFNLCACIESCPLEFARKPRSLNNFKMFKATEWRTFLLYTGMVALKGIVKRNIYKNFLLLLSFMRVHLNSSYCADTSYRKHARKMVKAFICQYRELYGAKNVVYNVHNLIHIHRDSKEYGSLDTVSAFNFENYLQNYKRMIRHGHNTMQQLIRRIDEERRFAIHTGHLFSSATAKKYFHKHDQALPQCLQAYSHDVAAQYKAVQFGMHRYSAFTADSCIRLRDGSVGKVMNVLELHDKSTLLVYREYRKRRPFFKYPMDSQFLGISEVKEISEYMLVVQLEQCAKAWLMPQATSNYFVAVDLVNCKQAHLLVLL